MTSKRRNMFYENKKQETTEIGLHKTQVELQFVQRTNIRRRIIREDPCDFCMCLDGEVFCWWQQQCINTSSPTTSTEPFNTTTGSESLAAEWSEEPATGTPQDNNSTTTKPKKKRLKDTVDTISTSNKLEALSTVPEEVEERSKERIPPIDVNGTIDDSKTSCQRVTKTKVKKYTTEEGVTQNYRCQLFGHGSRYYNLQQKFVRCARASRVIQVPEKQPQYAQVTAPPPPPRHEEHISIMGELQSLGQEMKSLNIEELIKILRDLLRDLKRTDSGMGRIEVLVTYASMLEP
ncbi:hypothetical protein AAG570_011916 [Ranatra chinensis]|uniref:Uncharacterized protein n=1 Tax=Ranatra chinensis TaxID=642074 RepID=A0ABD0YHP9_9HEMI